MVVVETLQELALAAVGIGKAHGTGMKSLQLALVESPSPVAAALLASA